MTDEKKRSTNPFLYTDGSLVEEEVLQAEVNSEGVRSVNKKVGGMEVNNGVGLDPDQTPQAELSARQVWGRAGVISMDLDDEKMQTMTGSYSEILERPLFAERITEEQEPEDEAKDEAEAITPVCADFDPVQAFLTQERLSAYMARDDSQGEALDYGAGLPPQDSQERPWSLQVGRCSPDQAESALQGSGVVTRHGDIISYVADDLHTKIKLASPVSKTSFPGSRSSTPSLLRTALAPQIPPIDPTIINDIEAHARHIATSVDTLIENLTGTLLSISSLTVDCVETYRDAVCKTCDAVDANIKSMYQLMAKTEELSKSMKPVYKLQEQIYAN
ncbi:BLOC-1-related complex subunit 6 isoform X2 [Palaemon carinicauda]|uniref:BLOC-1-related complex subunit 6 isoform X2 n=1 Tax=Palaemon carinicauda TaxID=392227 RepID=UPI0035B67DF3